MERDTFWGVVLLLIIHIEFYWALSSANAQNSYLVKRRQVTDVPEALTLLRRFIQGPEHSQERCEKYAVLLHMISSSQVDQFAIADLGLATTQAVSQKIKAIDVETLRQLYIDGINKFEHGSLDTSMLELVDCLNDKFRLVDAKARSFLNNRNLQDTVSQYKSILSQPLSFVVDPNAQHPTLKLAELRPAVKETLVSIFNGDVDEAEARFSPRTIPRTPHVEVEVGSSTLTPIEKLPDDMSDEEREYLNSLVAALSQLFHALVQESKLNDRCLAYSKAIDTEHGKLDETFVNNLVKTTSDKITSTGSIERLFVPEKRIRDNFLFALSTFGPEDLGEETWVDLIDCVSQWESVDPQVKDFMHSPELAQIFQNLLNSESEAEDELQMHTTNVSPSTHVRGDEEELIQNQ